MGLRDPAGAKPLWEWWLHPGTSATVIDTPLQFLDGLPPMRFTLADGFPTM
jgi:hypothetical protein